MNDLIYQASVNTRLAAGVAITTTSVGVRNVLNWIPDDIGKLTSLVGGVLTIVLIITHVTVMVRKSRQYKFDAEKQTIELELLK